MQHFPGVILILLLFEEKVNRYKTTHTVHVFVFATLKLFN